MKGQEGVSRIVWVIPIFLLAALIYSPKAEAGSVCRLGHGHHHGRQSCDHSGFIFSGRNISISIGGHPCNHCGKRYCRIDHYKRVIYREPRPIIITSIPFGCRKVRIDGRHYYKYNDTYYIEVAGGYRIVDNPERNSGYGRDENDFERPRTIGHGESFTVNIPNSKGGYTAVTLKRSGSGYTGPQGEYYSEFPRVDQLRAMYEK